MYVKELTECRLAVADSAWTFAEEYAVAIEQNWAAACAQNANLFNGDMFIVDTWSIDQGVLAARVLPTKFAPYLYWRSAGRPAADGYDEAFALCVVVSSDGGVLLAESVSGTLNEGLYGPPGGLLDRRDVSGDDAGLDVSGAAVRELHEETGLLAGEMARQPGYLLARVAPYLGVASVFRSALAGPDLVGRVKTFLDGQAEPELAEPRVVYSVEELDRLPLTPFARLLTRHVLGM